MRFRPIFVVPLLVLVHASVFAQGAPRTQRLRLIEGGPPTEMSGVIMGDAYVDYVFGAAAGQSLTVTLKSSHRSLYFNVLPPGSQGEAIFNGSSHGDRFRDDLRAAGDYTVRVYLMRNAARRDESGDFDISLHLRAGRGEGRPAPEDAKVAGTPFHATGTVPCSFGNERQRAAQCPFGVIREGRGRGTVHLVSPGQSLGARGTPPRVIRFDGERVTAEDPRSRVRSYVEGDEWIIDVDGYEHYVIPFAVINGG